MNREAEGPDVSDGCSAEGFIGGCVRCGCHNAAVMQQIEKLRMVMHNHVGNVETISAFEAAITALAAETRIVIRNTPNEPWAIPSWMSPPPPRIVCAALMYPDATLVVGPRHFDHVMQPHTIAHREKGKPLQGFIDQHGLFYTRKQAWDIAAMQRQIARRVGGDGFDGHGLFSENLY